jgi:predicted RNA-binding Zn ribbon-like protein
MDLPSPDDYTFDLSGGAPCLDLPNTVSGRGAEAPVDHLRSFSDLVAWSRQGGLLDTTAAARLRRLATERAEEAAAVLGQAIELREALFALFAALAAGRAPAAGDLAILNRVLAGALDRLELAPAAGRYAWAWRQTPDRLDAPLGPVAWSAATLLVSPELTAIRECASPTCRWLFLDHSRNQSRRWCDMKTCGNRVKVRRHYQRQRAGGGG